MYAIRKGEHVLKIRAALILMAMLLAANAFAVVCVPAQEGAVLLTDAGVPVELLRKYDAINPLGAGLLAAKHAGAYALMNEAGAELTSPVYTHLRCEEDILLAEYGGFWGMLDTNGAPLCEFEYTWILPTGAGNCWALRGDPNDNESDELFLLDASGAESTTGIFVRRFAREAGDGLLALQPSGQAYFGYCDANGNIVIPAQYASAGTFANGIAPAVRNGKFGIITPDGKNLLPFEYDFIELSQNAGCIAAKDEHGVYMFAASGEKLAEYPGAHLQAGFIGNCFMLYDGASMRLYDPDGALRHMLSPETAVSLGVDDALIFADGAWGESCVWLEGTQEKYQHLYPLGKIDGEALYACMKVNVARYMNDLLGEIQLSTDMDSARWGVVDAHGKLLLDCVYDSVEIAGGKLLVQREGLWQLISPDGTIHWEETMPEAESSSEAGS